MQRVSRASVEVSGEKIAQISEGLLVLLGVKQGDGETQARWLARKICKLRIFEDQGGKMNRSVEDISGEILVVSQFTLYGNCRKGNRPSFAQSAPPDLAEPLYERFASILEEMGLAVSRGRFAAMMEVELINSGPVSLMIESPDNL